MTRRAPPAQDWRDPRPYAHLHGIDRAGMMWEWLRRDPDYIAWQARASSTTRGSSIVAADPDAIQWGIHFRRTSGHRSP